MFIKKNKLIGSIIEKSLHKIVYHNPDDYKFGSFKYEAHPYPKNKKYVEMIITGLHRLKHIRIQVCKVIITVETANNFHPVWINLPNIQNTLKDHTGNITGYR